MLKELQPKNSKEARRIEVKEKYIRSDQKLIWAMIFLGAAVFIGVGYLIIVNL